MSVQWIRHDHRLDVELAVAFDTAGRLLTRARSPRQLDQAIVFNLRLWREVRRLAERCPTLADRDELADAADHVATMLVVDASPCPDPRDIAFVAGRNLALAGDLAGTTAAARCRDALLAEWGRGGGHQFEEWLLARLAACSCPPG
ncbi:MAG: hypothetical protein ACM33T_16990 [Solirubrobacterales bacterium]